MNSSPKPAPEPAAWQPAVRHQKLVQPESIAFSPDKKTIALVDQQKKLQVYELGVKKRLASIDKDPKREFLSVAFSANGKRLSVLRDASFFDDKHDSELLVYDTAKWKEVKRFELEDGYQIIKSLPKRNWLLVTTCYCKFLFFDLAKLTEVKTLEYEHERAWRFSISPDEKFIAMQMQHGVSLVDLDSGEQVWFAAVKIQGWGGEGASAFSPDGSQIAVSLGDHLVILDAKTGRTKRFLRRKEKMTNQNVIFSPDGQFLLASEHFIGGYNDSMSSGLRVWHPETGTEVQTVRLDQPHHHPLWQEMEMWPDDQTLTAVHYFDGELSMFDLSGMSELELPPPPEPIVAKPDYLQTSPKGQAFLSKVLADFENVTPRKQAGKWLAKNGDPERGEFILKQCSKNKDDQHEAENLLADWFDAWTLPLANFNLGPDDLEFRNGFPFRLRLSGSDVNNDAIKQVLEFPTLEEVDLSGSEVTTAGVQRLTELPNLRILDIRGTKVTVKLLEHLHKLEYFQMLKHPWSKPEEFAAVQELLEARNQRFLKRSPKEQKLEAKRFFDAIRCYPKLTPSATKAHLSQCGMTDADLCYLTAYPKLHTVNLFEAPLSGSGLHYLEKLKIRSLDLSDTNVSDLKVLANFKYLEELKLADDYGALDVRSFQSLAKLPLKSLTCYGSELTDEAVPYLLQLKSLEKLDLEGSDLSEAGTQQLKAGLPNLVPRHFKHDWK